jgi:hypothetical protein
MRFTITPTYRARVPSPGWEKVRMRAMKWIGEATFDCFTALIQRHREDMVAFGVIESPSP